MRTTTNSILKQSAAGCVLAVMLLQSAGSPCAQTRVAIDKSISSSGTLAAAATTQTNNITGTWNLSIRYTGGDDLSNYAPKQKGPRKVSGNVRGRDVSPTLAATNNVGEWITARFISFRVMEPPPGNLTLMLKQEGEKVAGTYSAPVGRQKVSGIVRGKDVSFSVAVTNNVGERITGRFAGEVLSPSKMEGTVTYDLKSFFDVRETGLGPARSNGEFGKRD